MEVEVLHCRSLEFLFRIRILCWDFPPTWTRPVYWLEIVVQHWGECLPISSKEKLIPSFLRSLAMPIVSVRRGFSSPTTPVLLSSLLNRFRNPTEDDSLRFHPNPEQSFVVEEVHSLPKQEILRGRRREDDSDREKICDALNELIRGHLQIFSRNSSCHRRQRRS